MAVWEIRRVEDEPVRVELDDRRNLAQEYKRAIRRTVQLWEITKSHVVVLQTVKEVRRIEPRTRPAKNPIGFHVPPPAAEQDAG